MQGLQGDASNDTMTNIAKKCQIFLDNYAEFCHTREQSTGTGTPSTSVTHPTVLIHPMFRNLPTAHSNVATPAVAVHPAAVPLATATPVEPKKRTYSGHIYDTTTIHNSNKVFNAYSTPIMTPNNKDLRRMTLLSR